MMLFTVGISYAQTSSMTDDEVLNYIMKEYENGSTQQEIVTDLMKKGVNIEQIRRVRTKYERVKSNQGLGAVSSTTDETGQNRLRGSNTTSTKTGTTGKTSTVTDKERATTSQFRIKDTRETKTTDKVSYDATNEEWVLMQNELGFIIPDTVAMLEKLMAEKNKRKVFGRDIFNNEFLTFEPAMNIATPQDYRLGPGDNVFIDIYGASQKTIECTVSPDGMITIEGYGPVQVGGMTVDQANRQLRSTLGTRYSSSNVTLTVGQTRTISVNVMGEVTVPGTYTLSAFATVFHALYMAGGPNDIGTLRNIKVYRNNRLISVVDIYDYILNGKLSGNVRLQDDDVIVVGAYECLVNITGKVKRPMFYEMRRSESVATLLQYCGGFTGDAYKESVRLVRKAGKEYSVYNIDEFNMSSFTLEDEDSLGVDSVMQRFSNMVEVKGSVFRPGMYQVGGSINSVRTLLEHAGGVKEDAFTARAVMHRMKPDRTLEVISVDVDGIMNGTVADIAIQNNDVLFIPTKQEMMEQQTITIHGEVFYPGIYVYADNETIEDFILQAGGLKETASTVKVDVARRIVNPKALTNDSVFAHTYSFELKDGFVIDGEPGFNLMPFDEVYVRRSPGFNKQQNVDVEGEVMFSGTYTLSHKNMRLSDLIALAGGVNDRAYVAGARLEREYTDAERQRAEDVMETAKEQYQTMLLEETASSKSGDLNKNIAERLNKFKVGETYTVGIELDKALENPGGEEDLVVREGDKLIVPEYNGTVKINGEVLSPNSVAYVKGKSAKYYIDQAGGFTSNAKKRQAYIMYMNGMVARVSHNAKPMPGCEIVVPSKSITKMTTAEKLAVGTSVASIAAMVATIANAFD